MDMKTSPSNESKAFKLVRWAAWLTLWGQSQEAPKRLWKQLWGAVSLEKASQGCADVEFRTK